MQTIPPKLLQDLAYLARLPSQDCHALEADLIKIINMVEQINTIDTTHVDLDEQFLTQNLAPDVVTEQDQRQLLQQTAPEHGVQDSLYVVPKVID